MRKFFTILAVAMLAVSCHQEYDVPIPQKEREVLPASTRLDWELNLNDSLMVLGPQLENPYAVATMQEARRQLMEEDPSLNIPEITTSHIYARFAPANDDELYTLLQDSTIHFYDFPLDRNILSGVFYHDPAIVDSLPTYQYASIPVEKWLRDYSDSTISHEILEYLFIPEDEEEFFGGGGDDDGDGNWWDNGNITPSIPENPWIPSLPGDGEINPNTVTPSAEDIIDMLVDKAMYLTGNLDSDSDTSTQSVAGTNSSSSRWTPSGRITAYDNIANAQIPLEGVKVRARVWFTTHTGITDADGYFTCDGTFKKPANYCIKWERAYWDIREGDAGQAYYNGPKQTGEWNLAIASDTPKSLAYTAIHRGMHRIYYKDLEGLAEPNKNSAVKIKIAYHHKNCGSVIGEHYNNWWHNIGIAPRIKIYGLNDCYEQFDVFEIFSTTCHELGGHAVHKYNCPFYSSLGTKYKEAWAMFAEYYLTYLEYRDLGVLNNFTKYPQNGYVLRDYDFNGQNWHKYDTSNNRYLYPPIFIDVFDDYNQFIDYYDTTDWYPYDNICYTNVHSLTNFILTSHNFNEVKVKISTLFNPNTSNPIFDIDDLNTLFEYYEY